MNESVALSPNNPVVEVGETLVLICRIMESYRGPYNSSAVCFGHINERYCLPPEVLVIDSNTAELHLTNVSQHNIGHVYCELPDLRFQWHARQYVTVASTYCI